jgi:hypothetical protein
MSDAIDPVDVDDDLSTLLARREHARPNRLTWTLLALLVLAVGFIGGALVEKRVGASETSLPDFAALAAAGGPPGALGTTTAGAQGGLAPGGALTGMTVGTVTLVDGTNLYITDSTGATVKVIVPATATVTAQSDVSLADLPAGTSVIVRGDAADDGTVTATSVAEGALPGAPTPTQGENS